MQGPIGARVKARLQNLNAKQSEVAARVGMSPDAFSRSVNGQRSFSALELIDLAEVLGTSMHWLATGEPDPYELKLSARHTFDPETRSHIAHDWRQAKEVVESAALAIRQADYKPKQDLVDLSSRSPTDAALMARRTLTGSAGADFVNSFPDAIEAAFGVPIFVYGHQHKFDAYAALINEVAFIVVEESGTWYRINWALAHELGHILRKDLLSPDTARDDSTAEAWANAFAAELLMPANRMREIDWNSLDDAALVKVVWDLQVSAEALSNRLSSGVVRGVRRQDLLQRPTIRTLEQFVGPFPVMTRSERFRRPRFPVALLDAHRRLVEESRSSGQTLAWMLGVPVEEINSSWGLPRENDLDSLTAAFGIADSAV
ncbi:helix-turn-helix domain-containing protein [Arthrobacter sp. CAN_A1]|uniref:helix-turn-helix domain-containing protein n=1 Tax=Arthrobacter sp. CAN_A1 TaxID=2787717 RepID=UPI0018CAC381